METGASIHEISRKLGLGQHYLGKMDYFYFFFHLSFNISKTKGQI